VARLRLARWRCWWSAPFGHADEVIDYVDALSGRWAARVQCARCGRETALAVRPSRFAAVFPNVPLLAMLVRPGTERALPLRVRGAAEARRLRASIEVATPEGERILVRRVRVHFALGRRRDVYVAAAAGRRPAIAADLEHALAGACGPALDAAWLERTTAQLEAELPADS
jgi:hypothetical protein